jgi:hypothetical protein
MNKKIAMNNDLVSREIREEMEMNGLLAEIDVAREGVVETDALDTDLTTLLEGEPIPRNIQDEIEMEELIAEIEATSFGESDTETLDADLATFWEGERLAVFAAITERC